MLHKSRDLSEAVQRLDPQGNLDFSKSIQAKDSVSLKLQLPPNANKNKENDLNQMSLQTPLMKHNTLRLTDVLQMHSEAQQRESKVYQQSTLQRSFKRNSASITPRKQCVGNHHQQQQSHLHKSNTLNINNFNHAFKLNSIVTQYQNPRHSPPTYKQQTQDFQEHVMLIQGTQTQSDQKLVLLNHHHLQHQDQSHNDQSDVINGRYKHALDKAEEDVELNDRASQNGFMNHNHTQIIENEVNSDEEANNKYPAGQIMNESLKKQHIQMTENEEDDLRNITENQINKKKKEQSFDNSDLISKNQEHSLHVQLKVNSSVLEEESINKDIDEFNLQTSPERPSKFSSSAKKQPIPIIFENHRRRFNELYVAQDLVQPLLSGTKSLQFSRFSPEEQGSLVQKHVENQDKLEYSQLLKPFMKHAGDSNSKIEKIVYNSISFNEEEQDFEDKMRNSKKFQPILIQDLDEVRRATIVSGQRPAFQQKQTFTQQSLIDTNILLLDLQSHRKQYDNKIDEIKMLKKKAQVLEKAIILFNSGRYKETIQYLISINEVSFDTGKENILNESMQISENQAFDFSLFLYETQGLDKNKIGDFLGSNKLLNQRVNQTFFNHFTFQNLVIDVALRGIFKKMRLPKEFQEIERIIAAFSKAYWEQNKEKLITNNENWTEECVDLLAMSILILNTNIHSDKIAKSLKLSKQSFVKTNKSILNDVVSNKFLSDIYDRIQKQQFEAKIELQEKFFKRVNDSDHLPNEVTRTEHLKTKGTLFTKYGRYGQPHKRLVYFNQDETKILWRDPTNPREKPRYIKSSDIQNVMIGADHTKVMQKHRIPLEFDNFCLSIITKTRTLDLRYDEQKIIQVWIDKLKKIVAMNSESRLDKKDYDLKFNKLRKIELNEVIEGIWKNEILLNWQNYWDPIRKQLKSQKVVVNISDKELIKISKQLDEIYEIMDAESDYEKKQRDITKDISTNIYFVWYQGLPNFARICVWPMLIGNQLSLSIHLYAAINQQFKKLKITNFFSHEPHLSAYLTPSGIYEGDQQACIHNQSSGEEFNNSFQLQLNKIKSKAHKYANKYIELLKKNNTPYDIFQDLIINILGTFSTYRPDIGFMSGLDKILSQLLLVYMPYQDFSAEVVNIETFESEIFTILANIALTNNHLPFFFQNNYDEISWRLNFFDLHFEKQLPQLSLHFKAINFSSQLYLYDWMLSLFFDVLPTELVWRIWDIYFLEGEIFLYKVALGILKFKEDKLISSPLNQCLATFKELKNERTIDEDKLFQCIESIEVSIEEFEDSKQMQLMGSQKATIFKKLAGNSKSQSESKGNEINIEDLELKFQLDVEKVLNYHFQVCKKLMILYIVIMILQIAFGFYWATTCGCFDDNPNNLICFMHYMKIGLNIYNIYKYIFNIKDKQASHPISSINSYITLLFYYAILFVYIELLKEDRLCLYILGIYPATDFTVVFISMVAIKRVKQRRAEIENKKEYKQRFENEMENKFKEILYLPIAYESDVPEEDDD